MTFRIFQNFPVFRAYYKYVTLQNVYVKTSSRFLKKYIYIDKVLVIFRKWNFAARETGVRVVEIANFLELSS